VCILNDACSRTVKVSREICGDYDDQNCISKLTKREKRVKDRTRKRTKTWFKLLASPA
jgi:hypothetical protein